MMDAKMLAELSQDLFNKKGPLTTLQQEIAENFYPQRADFTLAQNVGAEFASNLLSSYPVIAARELANQIGQMLRPKARPWFHVKRKFTDGGDDTEERQTLEAWQATMRRAMYDPVAQFNRACKAADADFSTFGQCALSIDKNRNGDALLYQTWHLRDMVWQEGADGTLCHVARRWVPSIAMLAEIFGKEKLHPDHHKALAKKPFSDTPVLHMVVDAERYLDNARGMPRWSLWWDVEKQRLIDAYPIRGRHYIIPRWQLLGSQYAHSPAVVAALPDARLLQAMTYTMLEVAEKASNPPLLATMDTLRSDVALYAGGITWVDKQYDERMGEPLRPLQQDYRGYNFGAEQKMEIQGMIRSAFFLDKITPFSPSNPEMTAFEVGQRVQEYIRAALPIFEPMEDEYNAAVCDETFGVLMRGGAFGSPLDWPRSLRGSEIDFRFESPLHDLEEQQLVTKWQEVKAALADAIALEPELAYVVDARIALRDTLKGAGVPAKWMRSQDEMQQLIDQAQQERETQQLLQQMELGSKAAVNISKANANDQQTAAPTPI